MTIKINEQHLGDIATNEQAERMVELLRRRGYDVEIGDSTSPEESPNNVKDSDWEECLDIISEESYG